jgi:hypothetical protein
MAQPSGGFSAAARVAKELARLSSPEGGIPGVTVEQADGESFPIRWNVRCMAPPLLDGTLSDAGVYMGFAACWVWL